MLRTIYKQHRFAALIAFALTLSIHCMAQGSHDDLARMENYRLRREVDSLRAVIEKLGGKPVINTWNGLKGLEVNEEREEDFSFGLGGKMRGAAMEAKLRRCAPSLAVPYDEVLQKYIDLYAIRRHKDMQWIVGRYEERLPRFREVFAKYGVPEDITALCIVESAVSPGAVSPVGAAGMWQFMPATAKSYGLRVDEQVDERFNWEKETVAAARHLADLRRSLGSWPLAVCAYNCGADRVRKAVIKAGGSTDIWKVMPFLPTETQGYLPSLIAVRYVLVNRDDYGLVAKRSKKTGSEIHYVKYPTTLHAIAAYLEIDEGALRRMNRSYVSGVIPEAGMSVSVPEGAAALLKDAGI